MARIKHLEIAGRDGAALNDFYGRLFDWPIRHEDRGGFDYYDVDTGGEPSCGIRHEPDGDAEIVIYVEVEDLDTAFAKACELGAAVRIPPMQYGDLRFALVNDPEGNPVGLTQAPGGA